MTSSVRFRIGTVCAVSILVAACAVGLYEQGMSSVDARIRRVSSVERPDGDVRYSIEFEHTGIEAYGHPTLTVMIPQVPQKNIRTDLAPGDYIRFRYRKRGLLWWDSTSPELEFWRRVFNDPPTDLVAGADLCATAALVRQSLSSDPESP